MQAKDTIVLVIQQRQDSSQSVASAREDLCGKCQTESRVVWRPGKLIILHPMR